MEVSLVSIHREERSLTFARIKKILVLSLSLQSDKNSLCSLLRSRDQKGGRPNAQIDQERELNLGIQTSKHTLLSLHHALGFKGYQRQ